MCIIQGKILRVNGTKIFVAPTKGQQQLTVYMNQVEQKLAWAQQKAEAGKSTTATSTTTTSSSSSASSSSSKSSSSTASSSTTHSPTPAMILPVHSKEKGEDVKLIDMSQYKAIFSDLEELFKKALTTNTLGSRSRATKSREKLKVFRVGSYDISIVPTREDFDRLDQDVFTLDENVAKLFSERYPNNFAFVVCKLVDIADYHPIAYLSPRLEDDALFVPTYHFHGKPNEKPDWDHSIYIAYNECVPVDHNKMDLRGGKWKQLGSSYVEDLKKKLESNLTSVAFDWDNITGISKTNIDHTYRKNHDIHVAA